MILIKRLVRQKDNFFAKDKQNVSKNDSCPPKVNNICGEYIKLINKLIAQISYYLNL